MIYAPADVRSSCCVPAAILNYYSWISSLFLLIFRLFGCVCIRMRGDILTTDKY